MAPGSNSRITTIGLDADDTLWQNERFFRLTQERFAALLADYTDPDHLSKRLLEAERRNLGHYGFGIKAFVLSMIETAIEITEGKVSGRVIAELIDAGKEMLAHPIELLPGVAETLEALAGEYRLVLITKGDLLDQERKLAQSGLGDFFSGVEIVSEKTTWCYQSIFAQRGDGAARAIMVGNSLRSDVIPAIDAGAHGVYVPHGITWALEEAEPPTGHPRYHELAEIGSLPDLLRRIGE